MELRRGSEAWLNAARDPRRWIRQESSAPSNKTPPCVMDKHLLCTAERRNVLGNTSPEDREILHPKAGEIARGPMPSGEKSTAELNLKVLWEVY